MEVPARSILVPETTVTVFVGMGKLVFSPRVANIRVNDTVHGVWSTSLHSVVSGTACTANNLFCSPANTSCATSPTSRAGPTFDRTFSAAGSFPYFCRPHCVAGMVETLNVLTPAAPGAVPDGDGVPGTPLTVGKGVAGAIVLSWGASCSAGATNYAVYEGTLPIPGAYNHVARDCSLGNVPGATITPQAAGSYCLVVPETATAEGSYGTSSAGAERPQGAGACHPQSLAACP